MFISPSDTNFIFFVMSSIGLQSIIDAVQPKDKRNIALENSLRQQGYGDLVDANPWNDLEYRKSGWQKFLSFLGFRTNYDVAKENQQFQSNEYLSNVQAMAQQNQYNTPSAQAERMREAGMNPDLQGTGDVAGAAGLPEDTNNTLPNTNDTDQLISFASGLMNAFTGAFGLFQAFGSIKNTHLLNRGLEIKNAQDLVTGAKAAISAVIPDLADMTDGKYDQSEFTSRIMDSINAMYSPDALDAQGHIMRNKGTRMSRKMYNQFFQAASAIAHSAPTKVEGLKSWIDELKSGSEFAATDSSKFTNADPSFLYDVFKPIIKAQDEIRENKTKFESEYQQRMTDVGGEHMANLDITGKELGVEGQFFENQSKEYQAILDRAKSEALRILEEKADAGNELAQHMLVVYSATGSIGDIFGQFFKLF